MDSDESRPGSSASNSSSSTSAESNENAENGSITSSRKSRSKSASSSASTSRENSPESQSAALKEAIIDEEGAQSTNDRKSMRSISPDDFGSAQNRSRSQSQESNRSASSNEENISERINRRNSRSSSQNEQSVSRNQSILPARQAKTSRDSSVSSIDSDNGRRQNVDKTHNGNENTEDGDDSLKEHKKHEPINISHDDLSDVSDLESPAASPGVSEKLDFEADDNEPLEEKAPVVDLRQKLDERKRSQGQKENASNGKTTNKQSPSIADEINEMIDKKHDEDALDFEAEDGECNEEKEEKPEQRDPTADGKKDKDSDGEIDEKEELEEGEVSDEDEKRPEETEPKPVCRFYTRGQCTWGMNCRFLHPGVTDKGNYTMFDMIRPVPVNHTGHPPGFHDFRSERPPMHHPNHPFAGGPPNQQHGRPPVGEPVIESAWERGLRTAKEMMRKANKRKEQDMDFDDKKMNLSTSQDEIEKDNYYARDRSPEVTSPPYAGRPHHNYGGGGGGGVGGGAYSPPAKFVPPAGRGPPAFEEDAYGRAIRYRELPPHRMPQYEDEVIAGKRRIRPTREVIVQRVEPVGRGDEWNDPWMRSKSPGREKRPKRRSYSSNSSYSSSSDSSQSDSSSGSSRSPSPSTRRRRYNSTNNTLHKSPVRRHSKRSPSADAHKRRHSPVVRRSPPPVTKKRQATPPSVEKRVARSPPTKRKRPSPPPPQPRKPISFSIAGNNLRKPAKRSSSSGTGSSDSSGSDSESTYSSSSSSSSHGRGHKREKIVSERKLSSKKTGEATNKKRSSPVDGKANSSSGNSKKPTRREELLKQLRAVEDAIARKRSKLS